MNTASIRRSAVKAMLVSAGILFPTVCFAQANKTVAIVNGEPILLSDYYKVAQPIIDKYNEAVKSVADGRANKDIVEQMLKTYDLEFPKNDVEKKKGMRALKDKVLEGMINDKILMQEAKKEGIRITRREIEAALAMIKKNFTVDDAGQQIDVTPEQVEKLFLAELSKQNMTITEYEKRITDQLMADRLLKKAISAGVSAPTDKEINEFYQKNKADMVEPEKVRIRHVLARVEPGASTSTKSAALAKIKRVKARLAAGEDFATVASETSEDPGSKDTGGDLGWVMRGIMVPEFEKAAFMLPAGKTSDIVQTQFGYHILKSEGHQLAQKKSLAEVREWIRDHLRDLKVQQRIKDYLAELRTKANIRINQFD